MLKNRQINNIQFCFNLLYIDVKNNVISVTSYLSIFYLDFDFCKLNKHFRLIIKFKIYSINS